MIHDCGQHPGLKGVAAFVIRIQLKVDPKAFQIIFFFILPYFVHPAKVLQSLRHPLDKEEDSNTSNKDTFETLQIRKSKRTTPQNQFSSLEFFIKSCRRGLNKLKHNHNTKLSNISQG